MNKVFREYIDEFGVVYLDDIVVYSQILEEYLEHLRNVLARLWEHQLYVKLSKCFFAHKQIDFLRHVIEEGWIKMDKQKIKAITDWPPPKDIHALRSFFGLCNFYRLFVKNYSLIAVPLIELLKKATPWDWGPSLLKLFREDMEDPSLSQLTVPSILGPNSIRKRRAGAILDDRVIHATR
nr:uncharacterized mitochondrial protein AtMg00860-like [Nicotiana tomentosiformis]